MNYSSLRNMKGKFCKILLCSHINFRQSSVCTAGLGAARGLSGASPPPWAFTWHTHGQNLAFLHQRYRCRHRSALCHEYSHTLFWPGFYGRYVSLIFLGFSQRIDLLDVDIKEASGIMLKVLSLQMDLLATSVKHTELLYR